MNSKELVHDWFEKWRSGDYSSLPLTDDFRHTSPYGTIDGREDYLNLVESNKDKFLGNRFDLHDGIYEEDRACVRYTMRSDGFSMEVSEWFFIAKNRIAEIVSYYNIEGEISDERKLSNLDTSD